MFIETIISSLEHSLYLFPFVLAVGITYKYLKVIDISLDGVIAISGITTVLVQNYYNCLLLSIFAGMLTGFLGGILFVILSKHYKIDSLITGIIISLFLSSLSVVIIGESIPLTESIKHEYILFYMSVLYLLFIFIVLIFFKTKLGLIIRAISDNNQITTIYNPNHILMIGHSLTGAILGIGAALYVNYNGTARAGGTFDFMLIGFTSLLASIEFFNYLKRVFQKYDYKKYIHVLDSMILQVIFGTIFFQLLTSLIITYSPIPTIWKLILSLILFISLAKLKASNQTLYNKHSTHNILVIENLKKSFYNNDIENIIFSDITVSFNVGLNVIIGDNGTGKSTFINCLSGELNPTLGNVFFNSKNITYLPKYQKPIFKINQEPKTNLSGELYSYENIILNTKLIKNIFTIISPSKVYHILKEKFDKNKIINKILISKTQYLSGGEAQYLSLFIASNSERNILILDEPTSNLDMLNQKEIINFLKEIAKSKILIVVSHDKLLINQATNVYKLKKGKLRYVKKNERLV